MLSSFLWSWILLNFVGLILFCMQLCIVILIFEVNYLSLLLAGWIILSSMFPGTMLSNIVPGKVILINNCIIKLNNLLLVCHLVVNLQQNIWIYCSTLKNVPVHVLPARRFELHEKACNWSEIAKIEWCTVKLHWRNTDKKALRWTVLYWVMTFLDYL